jgi:hypothetical protein
VATTMNADLQQLLAFYLTGEKPDDASINAGLSTLCPALLSKYRDLSTIRHDYPLVLLDRGSNRFVTSLTAVSNGVLQEVAPKGIEGERLRKNVLGLESEIRRLVSGGQKGSLTQLWDLAAEDLLSKRGDGSDEKETLEDGLKRARAALRCDGEVIDCNEKAPARLLEHVWHAVQKERSRRVSAALHELILKLSDILKADEMKSAEARSPEALRSTVGKGYDEELDFEALSNILTKTLPANRLPEQRRERVRFALSTLQSQRFFPLPGRPEGEAGAPQRHSFLFDSCTGALGAFEDRLAEMVALVKAVRIAELEIGNQYREARHDRFFSRFSKESLTAEDMGLFPSYLVRLSDRRHDDAERTKLLQILSSGLPMKIFLQADDALEGATALIDGPCAIGGWHLQLANMAVSLQRAYVLQSTSSNLYRMSEDISAGLEYPGPALFSVYSPPAAGFPNLPSYLVSASAMQSRAFPAFTYDPAAGDDWASRFSIAGNPQLEAVWPVNNFEYEDRELQRHAENVAFTLIDFAACDKRFAGHFMSVPESKWQEAMIPAEEYLALKEEDALGKVPYILMVDGKDLLQKVIVGQGLIRAARRCAEMWRNLEELGGIHNSHARRLLEREKQVWEEQKRKEIEELESQFQKEAVRPSVEEEAAVPTAEEAPEAVEEVPAGPIEEATIETPRCNTCKECINKNGKMFALNENKQAYIKDLNAGTYRDLVESAELCQVAIIHPGKPWNPDEPNLEELIQRAEPFNQPPKRRQVA